MYLQTEQLKINVYEMFFFLFKKYQEIFFICENLCYKNKQNANYKKSSI